MKMFDQCVARIALSRNDNVLSAYRVAFEGEREQVRKQHDFAPKNAIHFISKLITGENLGRPRSDVYQFTN